MKTYTLDRISDLMAVPSDRREQCFKELLIGLEFAEFAEAKPFGPWSWTDDGDMSVRISGPAGEPHLTLKVTQ